MANVWLKKSLFNMAAKKKEIYCTRNVTLPRISSSDLVAAAARNSGLDRGTLQAAMDALNKEFQNYLLIGHSVEVPNIGTFRFRINAHGTDTEQEAGAGQIYTRKIWFQCNRELWRLCQAVQFEQMPTGDTEDDDEEPEPEP